MESSLHQKEDTQIESAVFVQNQPGRWVRYFLLFFVGTSFAILMGFGVPIWVFLVVLLAVGVVAVTISFFSSLGHTIRVVIYYALALDVGVLWGYFLDMYKFMGG